MKDLHDVDHAARTAGAELRSLGTGIAETEHAWAELVGHLDTDGLTVESDRDRFDHRPPAHDRRRWLAVAASLVLVAGLAATFVAVRNGSDAPASSTTAPSRFLLPKPGSGYTVREGFVTDAEITADRLPAGTLDVIGTPTGDGGFNTLLQVSVTDEPPLPAGGGMPDAGDEWEQIDTPAGPASVSRLTDFDLAVVAQQRGDRFVVIQYSPTDEAAAIDLLQRVTLGLDGAGVGLDLRGSNQHVLETVVFDGTEPPFTVASYSVAGPDIDADGVESVFVETVPSRSALVGSVLVADTVRPVTIDGRPGWEARRDDVDGEWTAYAWVAADGTMIAVSGHLPADVIRGVVDSLEIVDENTWRTATGAIDPS